MTLENERRQTPCGRSGAEFQSSRQSIIYAHTVDSSTVRRFRREEGMAARRRGEIRRLCESWKSDGLLPSDVQGLAQVAANALAFDRRQDLRWANVVDLCADLVDEASARCAVSVSLRHLHDDGPAFRLVNVSNAGRLVALVCSDRRALSIRTMAAIDETREQRDAYAKSRRRAADRERKARKRAEKGAIRRDRNLAAEQPWTVVGVSRATWFRLKNKGAVETKSPLTVLISRLRTFSLNAPLEKSGMSLRDDLPSPDPSFQKETETQAVPRVRTGRACA